MPLTNRRYPGACPTIVPALLVLLLPGTAAAQEPDLADGLSLDEAVVLAQRHNPAYLATRNDIEVADWDVRSAYGNLLPSASFSSGMSWQGAGEQRIGSLTLGQLGFADQPSYYFSNYSLGLNYQLSGSSLLAPREARSARRATGAQIAAARMDLVTAVTRAYLEGLRQREAVAVTEAQLERSRFNLRLASGQQEVGAATPLDVRQAEVQVGRAEVALLQARARLQAARIRLLQQIGMPPGEPVELTTRFELREPAWSEEEILERALTANPLLGARRASADAAVTRLRSARSAYLPSLSMSAGIGGFTRQASSTASALAQARGRVSQQVEQCAATNEILRRLAEPLPPQDCTQFVFTDAMRRSIVESNDQFPLSFTNQPPQASLTVSVPIFQGLSRQRDVEAAEAFRDDARQDVRAQELAVAADVAVAFTNLDAAYQSAVLEARNRGLSEEQLRLARERYQLGAITFVDLVEAETVLAEADQAYINAVYAFHDAVTTLEAVVGQPLRPLP